MSKFGLPCVFDCEGGGGGWGSGGGFWGSGGTTYGGSGHSVFNPPPFTGYQGGNNTVGNGNANTGNVNNTGQTTVVGTTQINALLNNDVKGNSTANTNTVIQMDLFTQIKNLVTENPLIALGGVSLFIYLITKKK